MNKNKKGIQLNQAFGAVLTLVIVAILIIVAIVLFVQLDSTFAATGTGGTAVNETVAATTAGTAMAASTLRNGACGTITIVYNSTSNTAISSGNYSQTGCLIANTTGAYKDSWRVSYPYTYTSTTHASNASTTMITNFSSYPALIGLVGTIIFLGIVIGVLVASFVFGRKEGA